MADKTYDVCIVGSGAGASPVAYTLAQAGLKVIVLEKGPWFRTNDFSKDELLAVRRSVYTPSLKDEPQVIEKKNKNGEWEAKSNYKTGRDFWNGSLVGGSSNFMSGYFHRMKPMDFRLLTTYGPIDGANIVDWPITYEEMESYYDKVEKIVGVSGKVIDHKFQEPRSSKDFPQGPLAENIISNWLDEGANKLGYQMVPVPRAILSKAKDGRDSCYYSNFCGSYACSSNAKGSARAALLDPALKTGNLRIINGAKVFYLNTDGKGNVTEAHYHAKDGTDKVVFARVFVVAAQAIETSRLLLMSKSEAYPDGLANSNGQVGKNIIFSAGGTGSGHFYYKDLKTDVIEKIKARGVFVNRSIQNWYEIDDPEFGAPLKGGTIDFLFEHANATSKAIRQKWNEDGSLLYGSELKRKLKAYFVEQRRLKFEVFNDWLPTDDCFVSLDPEVKDKWGDPVAKIRIGYHDHDLKVAEYLSTKAVELLEELGAKDIRYSVSGSPPPNLQSGGCRFGNDPKTSVLDVNCKAHDVNNLYVTDGSFMPTGGSITYTWTIYANAFRVADKILSLNF